MNSAAVGRLAPSPTGHLHLGHARSFLLAWWHARARGGRIVLRLEDLDVERVKPGMIEDTLADLRWLGLDWDGEVCVQSHGLAAIEAAVATLIERGQTYPCVCTRKEILTAASAPHGDETAALYPGNCRGRYASMAEAAKATGRAPALRFCVPDKIIRIEDGVQGVHEFDARNSIGDFSILRRLGVPAYQLAVVVDDERQGVNEIVRGADLLESSARQWVLQEALGYAHPRWWHVPLVTDAAGRRLAKRSDDVSLARLRAAGTDPRQIISWAARSAGLAVPQRIEAREVIPVFDIAHLPRADLRITPADLTAFRVMSETLN
jgi:glutamyl-tRNA synthetase